MQEDGNVSHEADDKWWRRMWNLKVPLRVRHFIWRAVRNILPIKDQLLTKRVLVIEFCPVCNESKDTVYHLLVSCPFAGLCWRELNIQVHNNNHNCFSTWISAASQQYNTHQYQEIIMTCWMIRKNRNEIVWNQKGSEFSEVCKLAKLTLNQWIYAQDKSFDPSLGFMTQEDGKEHWEHPQEGKVKINIDATLFENLNTYCLSMVARHHAGELITAISSCRQGNISPELAEALSIKEGPSWIKENSTQPTVVETDFLAIIQAIRCSSVTLSYLCLVVEKYKTLVFDLQSRQVTLHFVKCSANKLAHFLARQNSSIVDRTWNRRNISPEFYRVLKSDLKF